MSQPRQPSSPLQQLLDQQAFTRRHLGPSPEDIASMLTRLGLDSLDALTANTLPTSIQLQQPLDLEPALTETQALARAHFLADCNQVYKSYLGLGYYPTHTPAVIQRNLLENPGWYTAYTPYQPEISQGRLEMLLNFQQLVIDLTGMELANASLLDEATAAAEAMTLCKRVSRKDSRLFFVDHNIFPQTLDVLKTRAHYFGYELVIGDPATELDQHDCFAVLLQYPGTDGDICDLAALIAQGRTQQAMTCVASDLLALMLLQSPGELGADVVFGSAQRFGVPLGFGGPHAAFFATRDDYKRATPGRIIGVSIDSRGEPALRMAMQTREQHIRREKATSNICTAQALLANMAAAYAIYHGPEGLKRIAQRVHYLTALLAAGLKTLGIGHSNARFFDTLTLDVGEQQARIYERALIQGLNLRKVGNRQLAISLDETTAAADVEQLWDIFAGCLDNSQQDTQQHIHLPDLQQLDAQPDELPLLEPQWLRDDEVLTHPVFQRYHSETEMMRYLKRLENRDFSLTHGMIPLGSCTMKLNASSEMMPVSWPGFAQIHPFAPRAQVQGYRRLIAELEQMLVEITGYDRISMQPNSGAQGEYAGLLAIRRYQQSIGEGRRNICLIPASAHGTNPASAAMAAMKVVVVNCDKDGNVDMADLKAKTEQHSAALACIMITYPSTHGVFEENIRDICELVHQHGGQVYMDGANMNALVGLAKPGEFGCDVSHLNLHKTFAIPHGGGGPGMGPIGVKAHLAPFLPNHVVSPVDGPQADMGAVSAAPYGSGAILPISWAYCLMLGPEGLRSSSQVAILSANYLAEQLAAHYPVLYRGRNQRVAHECIIDIRPLKERCGITEEDIAKRLMDYGFHAPTMSFPVPGTLMIEPTESECKAELDRFIEAMISIRNEIRAIENGDMDADNNPLKNAPHTQADLVDDNWDRPYSRQQAAFPVAGLKHNKFWPAVNRIDNVYGDRHLICSCPSVDAYR